jgi:hypothetical protein
MSMVKMDSLAVTAGGAGVHGHGALTERRCRQSQQEQTILFYLASLGRMAVAMHFVSWLPVTIKRTARTRDDRSQFYL